jgi:hypothetical protein
MTSQKAALTVVLSCSPNTYEWIQLAHPTPFSSLVSQGHVICFPATKGGQS